MLQVYTNDVKFTSLGDVPVELQIEGTAPPYTHKGKVHLRTGLQGE
jgi:hypothetical protein